MTGIELTEHVRARLQELAITRGEPEHVTVEKAIELLRRQTLLDATNAALVDLQRNPDAWRQYQDELNAWDATLGDGLEAT